MRSWITEWPATGPGLVSIDAGVDVLLAPGLLLLLLCPSCLVITVAGLVLVSVLASTHPHGQVNEGMQYRVRGRQQYYPEQHLVAAGWGLRLNPSSHTFLLSCPRQETSPLLPFISLYVKQGCKRGTA